MIGVRFSSARGENLVQTSVRSHQDPYGLVPWVNQIFRLDHVAPQEKHLPAGGRRRRAGRSVERWAADASWSISLSARHETVDDEDRSAALSVGACKGLAAASAVGSFASGLVVRLGDTRLNLTLRMSCQPMVGKQGC